jgi:spermidine/putrescine transport system ATP-binding protein
MLAAIETQNLTRRFGSVTALDNVSLSIGKGEFFSLLGPSGCGKTTLLRLIAGLDLPDGGALRLNGSDAISLPAHRRPVNTVFQSYALFPHMTVGENVAFGLRMKKVAPPAAASRVARVLEMVDIGSLAQRRPAQLSGGQRQRVALARAIVNEPEVLLLDEPLGALDLKLRKQLQIELRQLQRRLGITFVYVTHDQDEALTMSDRIAVMNHGKVEQVGAPDEVYDRPRTRFAAEFLGSCNLLKGVANGNHVKTMFCELPMPAVLGSREINLTVRPENIRLANYGAPGAAGKVVSIVYSGSHTHYEVEVEGQKFKAFALNTQECEKFAVGQSVTVSVSPSAMRRLED